MKEPMQSVDSTIEIVWSAYRSVLSKAGSLAYVSAAITSGKLMQDVMDNTGLSDEELRANPDFFTLVIAPNLQTGTEVARSIAAYADRPVVAPTIFEGRPQRWSQADYMKMWLQMIEENVSQMFMSPGWEYSNGGCEEYLKAVSMAWGFGPRTDIVPLYPNGITAITLDQGMEHIAKALDDIHARGRKADTLASVFHALHNIYCVFTAPDIHRDVPTKGNVDFMGRTDMRIIKPLYRSMGTLLTTDYKHLNLGGINLGSGPVRDITEAPEGVILKPVQEDETA